MTEVVGYTLGQILTLIGFDLTSFRPVLVDDSGRVEGLLGWDGTNYHLLKTDADGRLLVVCVGGV